MKDHKAVREQVRLLWIANGGDLTKACSSANVPYWRAAKWKDRAHWTLNTPENQMSKIVQSTADSLQSEIEANGKETKLSLSRYARRAAKDSEQGTVRDAPLVHKVAQVAQIVHPDQFNPKGQDQAQVAVNIAILNA